ncbi:glycosyltransferase family 2 protein [Phaeovulum sp.]|uniref:glycosyltransferase family 2 protein n=1 Tax=Phaeovulum sp. TaxID=2934796 RepID=UPI0039E4A416
MADAPILPISVVIPTYNRASLTCAAIDSVLGQTALPDEILIVDDGSQDDTRDVLKERYGDRINYLYQENQGVAAARNTGIQAARCEFVAFLDSDDRWLPKKLELQFNTAQDPRIVLSATNWQWDEGGVDCFTRNKIRSEVPFKILEDPLRYLIRPQGHGMLVQTCLIRRDALLALGGFDTRLRITEDNDLIFRLADLGRFALLPEVLMSRCSDGGIAHLTDTHAPSWKAENLDNMIAILDRCLASASRGGARYRALRRRHGQLLVARARLYGRQGETASARALYRQRLRRPDLSKSTVTALVGLLAPALLPP